MNTLVNPTVKIYVRMNGDRKEDEREITFRIPEGVDALELLDLGMAIDGNQAAFSVAPAWGADEPCWEGPFTHEGSSSTLTAELAAQQRELVKFLRSRGFQPQFA